MYVDREADALAALDEVPEEEAAVRGEEDLADEAEAPVAVDGVLKGLVAAPRDLQGGYAANGVDDEEAAGEGGGGGGHPEKHF